jgi:hypothetical protein
MANRDDLSLQVLETFIHLHLMPKLEHQVIASQLDHHLIAIQVTTIHRVLDGGVDDEAVPADNVVIWVCAGEMEGLRWPARCDEDSGKGIFANAGHNMLPKGQSSSQLLCVQSV